MDLKKLEEALGIESLPEEDINQVSQEVEEIMGLLNENEDGIISLDKEESLEELMERDKNTELEDIDTDLINDISVYDTERAELSEEDKEKIEDFEEIENENIEELGEALSFEDFAKEISEDELDSSKEPLLSNTVIYSIVGILFFAIIIFSIFLAIAFKKVNSINLEKQIQRENEKVQATFLPEENNAAYLGIVNEIDGIDVTLEKIAIDSKYIKIYITSNIDYAKYDFILTDGGQKLYPTDINFVKQGEGKFEIRFYNDDTILNEYELNIRSIQTGETSIFKFKMPKIEKDNNMRYLNNITEKKADNFSLNITGGSFTANGSKKQIIFL